MSLYHHHHPIQSQSIHDRFLNHSHSQSITRPTLKRSQSPYTPDLSSNHQDRKKRKTSPTCAFAKLSLTTTTTSNEPDQIKPTSSSLNVKPKLLLEPNHSDQRMRSVYSAYEIEPNRIYVNSIGSDSEPTTPIKEESESNQFRITCPIPSISRIDLPLLTNPDDQQLVVYKPPVHLTLNHLHSLRENSILLSENMVDDVEVPMELD